MTSCADTLALRLHALGIVILAFVLPLTGTAHPIPIHASCLIFLVALMISSSTNQLMLRRLPDCHPQLPESLMHGVLLALWSGLFVLSANTPFPTVSIRYFPDLVPLYPVFFAIGAASLILIHRILHMTAAMQAWIGVLIMTSLPFTRPLTHNPMGMAFPLTALLFGLHCAIREHRRINSPYRFMRMIGALVILLIVHGLRSVHRDFEDVVPDALFYLTATGMMSLCWLLAGRIDSAQIRKRWMMFHKLQLAVMIGMVLMWFIWVIRTLELRAVVTYRLWISLIHPNALALYLAIVIMLLKPWENPRQRSIMERFASLSAVILLILTQSRGVLLGCAVTGFILFLDPGTRRGRGGGRRIGLWIGSGIGVLSSAWYVWHIHYRLVTSGMIRDRLTLWRAAYRGLWPLDFSLVSMTGFGWGAKDRIACQVVESSETIRFLKLWLTWDRLGRHFHNIVVEAAWAGGIAGVLLVGLLAVRVLRTAHRIPGLTGFYAAASLILIAGMVDCPVYYPFLMVTISGIVGIVLGSSSHPASSCSEKRFRGSFIAIAFILLIEWLIVPGWCLTACRTQLALRWMETSAEFAEACLYRAATAVPPSYDAARTWAERCLVKGRCDTVRTQLRQWVDGGRISAVEVNRLRAWLEPDEKKRSMYLMEAWNQDPQGLTGRSLAGETAISLLATGDLSGERVFKQAILQEPHLIRDLLGHGIRRGGVLVVTREGLLAWLVDRGIPLAQCPPSVDSVRIDVQHLIDSLELELSEQVLDPRVFEKRETLFHAVLGSGDYRTAGRLAVRWSLTPSQHRMEDD
ncbi:hypothetical protein JXA80_02360, partial [bacterium]|nr:hypothetical protein [candidate division CSSED10-310 bacterium]